MAAISTWSTTAASNNSSSPDGAPEGWAPSEVNAWARETMAAVRTQHEDAEWIDLGDTITYVSGTQFTINGKDVTTAYHVGRRIRVVGSTTGTIYGRITASSFSTNTSITVSWDSGSMSSETLTGSLGILSATNPSQTWDLNGSELVLDADGDSSITADTDDQVDVKVGGADAVTITSTQIKLTEASDGAGLGPAFVMFRDSASPAASDYIGDIQFQGRDSGANQEVYNEIRGKILDPTSGSEDSSLELYTTVAGTRALKATFGDGVIVGATGADKGVGTINTDGAIFRDGAQCTMICGAHFDGGDADINASATKFQPGSTVTLTDNGTGDYTFTMGTAFSSASYIMSGSVGNGTGGGPGLIGAADANPTTTAFRANAQNGAGTNVDYNFITVAFFGEQ
jgi:hypothetical protein